MSILGTSPENILSFDVRIAEEFKDIHSALIIEHLVNLSLSEHEKARWTEEKIKKILICASRRKIRKVIRNLEEKKILERLANSNELMVNIENLKEFVEKVGGER